MRYTTRNEFNIFILTVVCIAAKKDDAIFLFTFFKANKHNTLHNLTFIN